MSSDLRPTLGEWLDLLEDWGGMDNLEILAGEEVVAELYEPDVHATILTTVRMGQMKEDLTMKTLVKFEVYW
jgi:hypothetical protein